MTATLDRRETSLVERESKVQRNEVIVTETESRLEEYKKDLVAREEEFLSRRDKISKDLDKRAAAVQGNESQIAEKMQLLREREAKYERVENELDARMEKLEKRESEMATIIQREERVSVRESEIERLERQIEMRENEIEAKEQDIAGKESGITVQLKELKMKETQLVQQEDRTRKEIERRKAELMRLESDMTDSKDSFAAEERRVADRDKDVSRREEGLAHRSKEIDRREAALLKSLTEISTKEANLKEQESFLEDYRMDIEKREQGFLQREAVTSSELERRERVAAGKERDTETRYELLKSEEHEIEMLRELLRKEKIELVSLKEEFWQDINRKERMLKEREQLLIQRGVSLKETEMWLRDYESDITRRAKAFLEKRAKEQELYDRAVADLTPASATADRDSDARKWYQKWRSVFFGWQTDQAGIEDTPNFERTTENLGHVAEQIDEVLGRTSRETHAETYNLKSKEDTKQSSGRKRRAPVSEAENDDDGNEDNDYLPDADIGTPSEDTGKQECHTAGQSNIRRRLGISADAGTGPTARDGRRRWRRTVTGNLRVPRTRSSSPGSEDVSETSTRRVHQPLRTSEMLRSIGLEGEHLQQSSMKSTSERKSARTTPTQGIVTRARASSGLGQSSKG
eukprot:evm.model.scf_837.6 EVM.evm.TU.scf_837.6   scf_837:52682-63129(-)